jgi:hypothetical protein
MKSTKIDVFVQMVRVKAFSGQGRREHKLSVSPDGTVRVWDDVAGHYTTCHSLSAATQSRVRKLVAQLGM